MTSLPRTAAAVLATSAAAFLRGKQRPGAGRAIGDAKRQIAAVESKPRHERRAGGRELPEMAKARELAALER